jgi:hypothetical protein
LQNKRHDSPVINQMNQIILGSVVITLAVLLVWAAPPASGVAHAAGGDNTCVNCHQDQERLESLSDRGSRVYVDPEQYNGEVHSGLDCTTCHGGDPTIDDPHEACIDIANPNPAVTELVQDTCGSSDCHPNVTARHQTSLHATMSGHEIALINLLGRDAAAEKFQDSCNNCHASCAECHMERPGAHGLLFPEVASHRFAPEPGADVCWACHGGTGDTFFGEYGNEEHGPSAMAEAGMQCMDCHQETEVHGDGSSPRFIADSPKPKCDDCHLNPQNGVVIGNEIAVAPQYDAAKGSHELHEGSLSCESCHTEWYPNCWNCHQGREERATYDLYLAENPLTGHIHPAVHSPAAGPDWGGSSTDVGGGWAIKSRHSWGNARPCETCHTNQKVYIEGVDREARFVGVWNEVEKNATYVDEELVQLLIIDTAGLQASVHADSACADCHASTTSESCTDCHDETTPDRLADADWSRLTYSETREALKQGEELLAQAKQLNDVTGLNTWRAEWDEIRTGYLAAAQRFHSEPAAAQIEIQTVAAQSQALRDTIRGSLDTQQNNMHRMLAGIPFLLGIVGAVAVGVMLNRSKNE